MESQLPGDFSRRIRQLRTGLGMSQTQLAAALGVSVSSVSRWENGETQPLHSTWRQILSLQENGNNGAAAYGQAIGTPSGPPDTDVAARPAEPAGALPAAPTSFVGRARELADVVHLLAGNRLVTLTGPGGGGKTRLALAAAGRVAKQYADGIWLVELAALPNPKLLPGTVLTALGLSEQPGRSPTETLLDFLEERQVLLVPDGCEPVAGASAELVERLLQSCPRLSVLATSREPLNVPEETVWQVPALSLPDPRWLTPTAQVVHSDAVQLFMERTRPIRPDFALTEQTAAAVARICRRLDGMPLAIELAARVKGLSVEQVAERLDDRFRLLATGNRTAAARQQSLQAALDWSYDLLTEAEQALFARLSVFESRFTPDAAAKVCAGGIVEDRSAPDLLAHLAEKSMISIDGRSEGGLTNERWYRLLETARYFGRERLRQRGEAEATRHRYAAYYLDLAEQAEPGLAGPDQEAWLNRLEHDHDNLRAVLTRLNTGGRVEEYLRLAGALWPFWRVRGYWSEGRRWLEEGLAGWNGAPAAVRAKAYGGAGSLAHCQGDHAAAKAHLEAGLVLYRELGDLEATAATVSNLGFLMRTRGDYAAARSLYEQGMKLQRELADEQGIADSLTSLGLLAMDQGDYALSSSLHEESLAMQRRLGNTRCVAIALNGLGLSALAQGDDVAAYSHLTEALTVRRELGESRGIAISLANLGEVERYRKEYDAAQSLYQESLALYRVVGDRQGTAISLVNLGLVELERASWGAAKRHFEQSLALHHELQDKRGIAACLEGLAAAHGALAEPETALRLFGAAAALRESIDASAWPADWAACAPQLEAARTRLGETASTNVWMEGAAMSAEDAVARALAGGAVVAARAGGRGLGVQDQPGHVPATAPPDPDLLTPREAEVLALLAAGTSNVAISRQLFLSVRTVERHIANIYEKIGAEGKSARAAATAYAFNHGFTADRIPRRR